MKRCIKGLATALLSFSLLSSTVVFGQTLKPTYLSEMPAPARILSEIKGKDAEDTIERQMGAFQALIKMIDDMAWGFEKRYLDGPKDATPDEYRIKLAYGYAYADLWHKATRKEEHLYDHDRVLLGELLTKLFSQSFRDLYAKSNAKAAEYYKAYREKNSGVVLSVGPAAPKDEFHEACAAKGLDDFTCMMQQMMKGVMNVADKMSGPVVPGLRMNGRYQSGNFSMRLDPEGTAVVHCGDVFLLSSYKVERKNNQIALRLTNEKEPFTLALKSDGTTLGGPPTVAIHGHAPGGSTTTTTAGSTREVQTTTTTEMNARDLQASGRAQEATQTGNQTYAVKDTTTSTEYTPPTTTTVPVWPAKTAQCRLGVLPVLPERPSEPSKKAGGMEDFIDKIMPTYGKVPNGLRMQGTYYGEGGASIEFLPDKAIVACHQTLVEHPYTVASRAGQVLVNLESNGGAQTFTLTPEGTLAGDSARVTLNGRRKTGENQLGDPTYAPSSDACSYGVLSPRGASQNSANTASASNTVSPSPTANITATLPKTTPAAGTGSLSIAGNFAGPSSNLFASKPVLFLKASGEDILRREGFVSPPGAAVKSSIAVWTAACDAKDMATCKKGAQALANERVNAVTLTANGQAAFAKVPVGTYWVLTDFRYNNKHYVWNLRIDVRPGSNAVSLDQNNTFIVF